jgi:hypothetical protein
MGVEAIVRLAPSCEARSEHLPVDDDLLEVIEGARMLLAGAQSSADATLVFARALVQIGDACVIGLPCKRHGGVVHGREAEELREGIEKILEEYGATPADVPYEHEDYEDLRRALRRLLDDVDARDSLVLLEAAEAEVGQAVTL